MNTNLAPSHAASRRRTKPLACTLSRGPQRAGSHRRAVWLHNNGDCAGGVAEQLGDVSEDSTDDKGASGAAAELSRVELVRAEGCVAAINACACMQHLW